MNKLILAQPESLTMGSKEISNLTGVRQDNVKRAMIALQEKGVISFTQIEEKGIGRPLVNFVVNERDSYVVVAQLSPEFTAYLVDEWQKKKAPVHQIPQTLGEALQLAADQAKQLELQAPKVAFVDNCVERGHLMTATQVAQKHKISAVKLNRFLDEIGGVYNKSIKRGRAFVQPFIDKDYGQMKQTELGHSQCLFTTGGEQWINEKLITEGAV